MPSIDPAPENPMAQLRKLLWIAVAVAVSRALGELAETSLSAVLPLLVIFMKPPPTTWVAAVSRVQGWLIAIFPAAKPWARLPQPSLPRALPMTRAASILAR